MLEQSLVNYNMIGKVVLGLGLIFLLLGMFAICVKVLREKKFSAYKPKAALQVIQTHHLSNKAYLTVLKWHERNYLILCTGDSASVIDKQEIHDHEINAHATPKKDAKNKSASSKVRPS